MATTPTPGQSISIGQVNSVLGPVQPAPVAAAPDQMSEFYAPNWPSNAANQSPPIPSSGQAISLSQLHSRTSCPGATNYTLSSGQNLNLYTYATSQAPVPTRYVAGTPGQTLIFTAPPTTVIGSASTPQAALVVGPRSPTTFFPDISITLVNQGTIKGKGGNGGAGASAPPSASPGFTQGSAGQPGGQALQICPGHPVPLTVIQNTGGTIASGGGGGGGGFGESSIGCGSPNVVGCGGGGGGGGAGSAVGTGGTGGSGRSTPCCCGYPGTPGQCGTSTTGGTGGSGGPLGGGDGGNGGGLGQAGQASSPAPTSAGGSAGVAIVNLGGRTVGGTVTGPTT